MTVDAEDRGAAARGGQQVAVGSHPDHLARMFRRSVERYGYRPATRVRRDGCWHIATYAELGRRVDAVSRALVEPGRLTGDGLQPGDRVAILAHNCPEWIEADLAVMSVGGVPVPVYPTSTPDQIVHILTNAQVRVIAVADALLRDRVLSVVDRLPDLEAIVTFDPQAGASEAGGQPVRLLSANELVGGVRDPQQVADLDAEVDRRVAAASADDIASLIYTSGTTGEPKGVMISHGAACAEIEALDAFFTITADDHSLCFLPLSHAYEWGWSMVCLWHGCLNTFVPNPKTVGAMLAEVRPTLFVSVPKLYEQVMSVAKEKVSDTPAKQRIFDWALDVGWQWWRMAEEGRTPTFTEKARHRVADALVLKAIRDAVGGPKTVMAAGGAPLRREVEEFFAACGVLVCQGYGLTEASPLVSFNSPGAHKFGTAGRPLAGSEIRQGEDGEILFRGPNIMSGYWKNPEATAQAVQDGWLHTGDVGHIDEDGYLVITDRLKDIIVTLNGKNISPQPIEETLLRDPLFEHAVVLGDNRPCLTLLVKPSLPQVEALAEKLHLASSSVAEMMGSEELVEEIRRRVTTMTEKLPHQEQIRDLRVLWDDFTTDNGLLTPTLKVRRREVEKRFTEMIDDMYGRLARLRKAATGHRDEDGKDPGKAH